jgi:hypothetical protein
MRLALGWAEMGGAQVPSGHLVALIGDFLRDQAFVGEEPAGPAMVPRAGAGGDGRSGAAR